MNACNKRNKSSSIWYFFTVIDIEHARCNMCRNKLSYKSTTSNLRKHILRKHPTIILPSTTKGISGKASKCNQSENISSSSINKEADSEPDNPDYIEEETECIVEDYTKVNEEGTLFTPRNQSTQQQEDIKLFMPNKINIKTKKQIDNNLLEIFIKDFQPFCVVEDQGFKNFVQSLNPMYQLPSRHFISKTAIPALYEECYKQTVKLVNSSSSVCLTTDCWTSRSTDSYIALTVHFINNDFELTSLLLECSLMNTNHTSQNLAAEIKKIATEWNIENKVMLTISDNASNIKNAISKELGWKHFGCFAHTLNLIVNDALHGNTVPEILEKVKHIVAHFKKSSISNAKLMSCQKNNGDQPLKLIQDVATRWNSTYYMLERFSKLQIPIRTTLALLDKDFPIITVEEWALIKELCEILKPFEEVTKSISGEKYCTASLIIPLTNGLKNVCTVLQNKNLSPSAKEVVSAILKGLNLRLGNIENSNTFLICTFLDPRFKGLAFSNVDIAEHAKQLVVSSLSNKINVIEAEKNHSIENQKKLLEQNKENELSVWHTLNKNITVVKPKGTSKSKALIEIQRYIDDIDILPRQQNPIQWWKENVQYFPHLSNLTKKYLCVLGTSVPCERLFSKAGLLLSDRRSRLSPNKTQKLLFLNINYKNNPATL